MTEPIQTADRPAASYSPPPAPVGLYHEDPRRKKPFLAGILSAMPGLGQIYVGYYQRGFAHALIVASIISLLAADVHNGGRVLGPLVPLAGVFLAFFWLYNIIDAARRAMLFNLALAGGDPIELPQDFQAFGLRGSIVGGAVFIGLGVLLLSNTLLDVSLEWLSEWWPAALILFGGYLVFKAIQEKSKQGPTRGAASAFDRSEDADG
jgi:TM2 domain-containing membrane protein YozV